MVIGLDLAGAVLLAFLSLSPGFIYSEDCGLIAARDSDRDRAVVGSLPWLVEILDVDADSKSQAQTSSVHNFICQGTLISRRAILTAASCVTLRNSTVEKRPEDFRVKNEILINPKNLEVQKIILHHKYDSKVLGNNIAILWLKQPLQESKVYPICLSETEEAEDQEILIAVNHPGILSLENLRLVNAVSCRQKLMTPRSHPCAQFVQKRSFCFSTLGSALISQEKDSVGKWSLYGIRSGLSTSTNCEVPLTFTPALPYISWIQRELQREPPIYNTSSRPSKKRVQESSTAAEGEKDREPLTPEPFLYHHPPPKYPLTDAEVFHTRPQSEKAKQSSSKSTTLKALEWVTPYYGLIPTRFPISTRSTTQRSTRTSGPRPSSTSSTTERGYDLVNVNQDNAETEVEGRSNKSCPPILPQHGVHHICKHDEYEDVDDCSTGGGPGTTAMLKCTNYYKPSYGPAQLKRECGVDGRWTPSRAFNCQLECGISARPRRSYILNGIVSDRVSWPWHATLFRKEGDEAKYICGGTLISKSLLLTAAHCVTFPGTATPIHKDELRLIFASNGSNYTENLLDPISKANLFYAKSILLPDTYNGVTFESDIALIQLEFDVELSDYVRPICFPFQSKENSDIGVLQLSPGTLGQTVGFGIDETGFLSKTMKETSIPVVSHRECGAVLARFPSSSQFCAGYLNGTTVCNGDSGSGLFFSEGTGFSNRYIIQGIVSYGDHTPSRMCNQETYAVFTKVSSFAPWVQSQMEILELEF